MPEVMPWELHLIHYYKHLEIQDQTWQVWDILAVPLTRGSISQASSLTFSFFDLSDQD